MRELPLNKVGQKPDVYREWICKKCGCVRCNKLTHNHGVELDAEEASSIRGKHEAEKSESGTEDRSDMRPL